MVRRSVFEKKEKGQLKVLIELKPGTLCNMKANGGVCLLSFLITVLEWGLLQNSIKIAVMKLLSRD
jgi:hypothetical protein